jgi:hypothetical protein
MLHAVTTEADELKKYMAARMRGGVMPLVLMLAISAQLGRSVGICAADGYLEDMLERVISTIRANAVLSSEVAGHG